MGLEKPVIPFIVIRGHKLFLEYEGLHSICFQCGRYGHKNVSRPDKAPEKAPSSGKSSSLGQEKEVSPPSPAPVKEGEIQVDKNLEGSKTSVNSNVGKIDAVGSNGYGAWMVIKRNQRKKGSGKSKSNAKAKGQSSDNRIASPNMKNDSMPQKVKEKPGSQVESKIPEGSLSNKTEHKFVHVKSSIQSQKEVICNPLYAS